MDVLNGISQILYILDIFPFESFIYPLQYVNVKTLKHIKDIPIFRYYLWQRLPQC